MEQACPAVMSQGAGEDGVLEGFGLHATAGAGGVGIGGPPGWVGGQVTLTGSHLVHSSGNELAKSHKRPWQQCRKVQVVPWGREKGGPIRKECLSHPLLQGGVGVVHQGLGREGGRGAHKVGVDHGHPGQPAGEGNSTMSHRVHREVVSNRRDWAGCFPM